MSDDLAPPDLSQPIHVHVVGAGGAGMSAIATVLAAMGHTVTGSDLKASPVIDRLKAAGLEVMVGHAAENVGDADLVSGIALENRIRSASEARVRVVGDREHRALGEVVTVEGVQDVGGFA